MRQMRNTTPIRNFVGLGMRTVFSSLWIPLLINLMTALLPTHPVPMRQLYQPFLHPFQQWDRPLRQPLCPAVSLRSIIPIRLHQFLWPLTPFSPGRLNLQLLLARAVVLPLLTQVPQIICFPTSLLFISYKTTSNLKVRMGNNTYLPVLAQGSAIISLNGQRVLVRHALHIPGLAVPLYSLRAHFKQRGCGFIGSNDAGMLVYFPSFVLSVDTSLDCTLSYKPLGRSAPLSTLHYVQPRSAPQLYPSELSPSSNTVSTSSVLIEDDQSVQLSSG